MTAADDSARRVEIAIAVVEHEGRFLIGRREAGAPLEGLWEFPGGKISTGETPAEAAVRECLEETGLAVSVGGSYPVALYDYPHASVRLHFLACVPASPPELASARFRWVPAEELANYEFPPANAPVLNLLTGNRA